MTTLVVLAERPDDGAVLSELQPAILSSADATTLYCAALADVCEAIQHGEGDLLVNYPDPDWFEEGVHPEQELRTLLTEELSNPDAVRYEVQVGETYAGRVGNTLTHLLESEDERTVAVVDPTVSLLGREHIGRLAMTIRRSDVVCGPSLAGRLYLAGFSEPIDFADAFRTPAVETLTARALDGGHSVEFLPLLPRLDTPAGLATTVSLLRARQSAGRIVPPRTTALIEKWDLVVDESGRVSRDSDRS